MCDYIHSLFLYTDVFEIISVVFCEFISCDLMPVRAEVCIGWHEAGGGLWLGFKLIIEIDIVQASTAAKRL